jgi:hypothetical protein
VGGRRILVFLIGRSPLADRFSVFHVRF